MTITDNNGSSTLGGLTPGNQQIVVNFTDGAGTSYNRTFAASDFSSTVLTTSNSAGSRNVAISSWRSVVGADINEYRIYRLPETGGKIADYVQLGEWGSQSAGGRLGGYHLFGDAVTPAADMPTSGAATYNGMATGRYFNNSATSFTGALFTAAATVDVNFASRSARTNLSQFAYDGGSGPNLNITAINPIVGSSFGGAVSLPSGTGVTMTGTINGTFYGPSSSPASEVGAVFELFTPTQGIVGGLVAGR